MMRAVVLPEYNSNLVRAMRSLEVRECEEPVAKNDQVVIRIEAASCNPSDIAFMRGMYNIKKPVPAIMGFEGTGRVVSAGNSAESQKLLNKKISFFVQEEDAGSWAEYIATDWQNCIIIDEAIPSDQAASICINPFTAYALFQIVLQKKARVFIQNAANGQVGETLRSLARLHGIEVINIVRKEEHVRLLKEAGEKYCLDLLQEDFVQELNTLSSQKDVSIAFDAVSGEVAGYMLNAMAPGSELIVYGGLSGKMISEVNPMDVIFKKKSIKGFNLMDWKQEIGPEKFDEIAAEIQAMILSGIIKTKIQGTFPMDRIQEALNQYIRNMSNGKILLTN